MFYECQALKTLNLAELDTSNVTAMNKMFYNCSALETLVLGEKFDTSKVEKMFNLCSNLTTLDLSNFDTTNVTTINDMFGKCTSLQRLVLGANFKSIDDKFTLPNGEGWVNVADPSAIVSGNKEYAVINNEGKNTYRRFNYTLPTYPTNIKVAYSATYHQIRFTWDKVAGADRYGIAVYLAGKWRIQTQNITKTNYTTPKKLTPGKTYKVAIAARVDGNWETESALNNATVTVSVK